jgi:DNA-binding transcriptional LysR family regulator
VRSIAASHDLDIRLRSANRDECYALLLTRQADIILFYATDRHPLAKETSFVELQILGSERLVPVFATARLGDLETNLGRNELPVVVYPGNVFFGKVVGNEIWPHLAGLSFKPKAETALTLAALQFALIGVAVAWVPETLARAHLHSNDLVDLSATLGNQRLDLAAARLQVAQSRTDQETWDAILSQGPRCTPVISG